MSGEPPVLKVFIGYDPRQPLAHQVAAHSVWRHASKSVSITSLQLSQLPLTRRGLTEFTYSRFLVPWLCRYVDEYALFIDSDVLVRGDIVELLALAMLDDLTAAEPRSVWVVPHAKHFERPSVMVFRPDRCRALTPEFVDSPQSDVFRLGWAEGVGELPREWNHLVGYDPPNADAKLVHFTAGIPCWPETENCEHSQEWRKTAKESFSTVSFAALMGPSVHVGVAVLTPPPLTPTRSA